MGTAPSPDSSVLQDHIQPVVSTVDSGTVAIMKGRWKFLLFFVSYSIYLSLQFVIQLGWPGLNVFTFLYAIVLNVSNLVLCII